MARIVRAKNASGSSGTWVGKVINAGEYYQIPADKLHFWAIDDQVFQDVGNGNLVINSGSDTVDDITNTTEAWNWLTGNTEPPRSADGDWHVVHENFAHVSGNTGLNWTLEKFLDANATYKEKFVVPDGKTFTLDSIEGGSATVPLSVKVEWFIWLDGDFCRVNPEIDVDSIWTVTANGAHSSGVTSITVSPTDTNSIGEIEPGHCYGFIGSDGNTFIREIASVDTGTNTLTLNLATPIDLLDGAKIGLVDRAIGIKSTQTAGTELHFPSPPRFQGDGTNYVLVTLQNNHSTDGGLITGLVNGWITNSVNGD